MKKVLSILVLLLLVSSAFAERKKNYFGVHFSMPVIIDMDTESGVDLTYTYYSVAFGISGMTMFTEKVGLFSSVDFFFPFSVTLKAEKNGTSISHTYSRSDFDTLWGMSFIIGPAISVIQNEKMLFTVSPGLHYRMIVTASDMDSYIGLGCDIQDSIEISDMFSFYFGGVVAFDFYNFSTGNTMTGFCISPKIGIAFKY